MDSNPFKMFDLISVFCICEQESTLLDLKASEEGLRDFDFICKIYEEKLKFLCLKLQEKCNGKPLSKHEIALEDFRLKCMFPPFSFKKLLFWPPMYKNYNFGPLRFSPFTSLVLLANFDWSMSTWHATCVIIELKNI